MDCRMRALQELHPWHKKARLDMARNGANSKIGLGANTKFTNIPANVKFMPSPWRITRACHPERQCNNKFEADQQPKTLILPTLDLVSPNCRTIFRAFLLVSTSSPPAQPMSSLKLIRSSLNFKTSRIGLNTILEPQRLRAISGR